MIPEPSAVRDRAVASLVRACIATGMAAVDKNIRASDYVRRWGDQNADLILRAVASPATIANTPALTQVAFAFLQSLVPLSAGAGLLTRAIGLNFNGAASINVPGISIPNADFVSEGAPIPVVQSVTSVGTTLKPFKLAVISALSGEMMRHSSAEQLVRQVLIEACGPAIDKVLFSSNAAVAEQRPAGLLNGIAALTPAAAGGQSKGEVLVDDLQKLGAAVAPVAGNGNIILVASVDAAVALVLRMPQTLQWPVLTSSSLAARTVIAVAANAVVSALEGTPEITASQEASLHFDTAPGPLVDFGGVAARPVGSLWQTDVTGLRLLWPISWALRDSRGIAWMTGVNW